jgi:hypothetical protein
MLLEETEEFYMKTKSQAIRKLICTDTIKKEAKAIKTSEAKNRTKSSPTFYN